MAFKVKKKCYIQYFCVYELYIRIFFTDQTEGESNGPAGEKLNILMFEFYNKIPSKRDK